MAQRLVCPRVLAVFLSLATGLPTVHAASVTRTGKVSLGDVVVQLDDEALGSRQAELTRTLRTALAEELKTLAAPATGKRSVVVSAALTKLSTERRAERARATAGISLVLRRADDQVLFAELRGRASVEEASDSVAGVQQAALRGAVRGAVARLPEAIERAP
jgi:hypothetical protein